MPLVHALQMRCTAAAASMRVYLRACRALGCCQHVPHPNNRRAGACRPLRRRRATRTLSAAAWARCRCSRRATRSTTGRCCTGARAPLLHASFHSSRRWQLAAPSGWLQLASSRAVVCCTPVLPHTQPQAPAPHSAACLPLSNPLPTAPHTLDQLHALPRHRTTAPRCTTCRRDGTVFSAVLLSELAAPEALYRKLGAKLVVGMPFKDIATSDSILMRQVRQPCVVQRRCLFACVIRRRPGLCLAAPA